MINQSHNLFGIEKRQNDHHMENGIKKLTASILILAVLFFSTLAVLSIWDMIEIEHIFRKSLLTLVVIFSASAIILFVFSNFLRGDDLRGNNPPK